MDNPSLRKTCPLDHKIAGYLLLLTLHALVNFLSRALDEFEVYSIMYRGVYLSLPLLDRCILGPLVV